MSFSSCRNSGISASFSVLSYFSTIESCLSSDTEYLLFLLISEAYAYSKSKSAAIFSVISLLTFDILSARAAFDISFEAISTALLVANSVASTVETVYLSGYDSIAGIIQSR